MTGLALHLSQYDMAPVRIEDVIGLLVQTFPGDFFSLFRELPDFFLLGIFCKRLFVTLEAGRYRRETRESLIFEIGMAGDAIHPLLLMFLMVEGNGLVVLRAHAQADQDEKYNPPDPEANQERFHCLDNPTQSF